ncbi:MAG TPA: DNA-3-methyladenine glycosylase [Nitrosopumilaceae archaeon]|nr:DNA-3-methyladenine glycosylase [Nitrosopumilaceae archaeon]
MKVLPRSFYARNTVNVAKELLGKTLVRKIGNNIISGIITETEAYRYKDDPASHAFRGMTERNKIMFGEVGRAYVYFTYGMHYCVNAVAKSNTFDAGAVLIRSIKPDKGINEMIKNRKIQSLINLTNGPAKLTQAMGITTMQYGEDLVKYSSLFITEGIKTNKIFSSPRIGIKKGLDKLWNFKIES